MALTVAAQIAVKAGRLTTAYQFAVRAAEKAPDNSYCWSNLAMMQDQLYRFADSQESCQRALSTATSEGQKAAAYLNWGCLLVNAGRWQEAEPIARQAWKLRPDSPKAQANLGMALLGLGRWQEGWPLYNAVIGFDKARKRNQYNGEPVWDGSRQKIVIYGEQGLGDEISFASMVPDAIQAAESVVLDCDAKLANLFRRSFACKVYGTRWDKQLNWDQADTQVDASISIGGLGQLFRPTPSSCPGTPYLIPDPERVRMWKGLFSGLGKPVIGIGWSGGVPWTADRYRKWDLESLLPLFRSIDAVWVSLQYKDAAQEIAGFKSRHDIDLRQYPFATLTQDYDDTVGLMAACDQVVAMQSAIVHAAGAVGQSCYAFVNKCPQWRYGVEGDMPWYRSVKLFRQAQDGAWPLDAAIQQLKERF